MIGLNQDVVLIARKQNICAASCALEPASALYRLTLQREGKAWNVSLLTMCSSDRVPGSVLQDQSLQNEKHFSSQILNGCLTVAVLHCFGNSLLVTAGSGMWGLCLAFLYSSPHPNQRQRKSV